MKSILWLCECDPAFSGCFSCRNCSDDDKLYVSKQQAFCEHVTTLEFSCLCFSTVFVS